MCRMHLSASTAIKETAKRERMKQNQQFGSKQCMACMKHLMGQWSSVQLRVKDTQPTQICRRSKQLQ